MSERVRWAMILLLWTGAAAAETCRESFPATMTHHRYQDNGNGTITDLTTGLIWKRCVEGLSGADCASGRVAALTWPQSLRRAADEVFAGSEMWRLPSKEELATLVESGCRNPSTDTRYFPNTPADWLWSASTGAGYPYYAWSLHFGDGHVGSDRRTDAGAVRLVRYGP